MLTTETQKRLTEFLGECWHMPGIGHCHICDKLMAERLDFTDWRVVGRLQSRLLSDGVALQIREFIPVFSPAVEVYGKKGEWYCKVVQENLPMAICAITGAYLEGREGK